MRNFPPITVGTEPYEFDPSGDGRRLKYLRVKSITGGQTAYMGPRPLVTSVTLGQVEVDAGTTRLKLSDYEIYVQSSFVDTPSGGAYIQPGWLITSGSDAGVRVKRVYNGYIEFDSALSATADDLALSPPYEVDYFNGFPILSPDDVTISDISLLDGPIWFATSSGTATLHILFELT